MSIATHAPHSDRASRRGAAPELPALRRRARLAASGGTLQRSAACPCGGSCPRCRDGMPDASSALADAAGSPGTPLRADIRSRFEASLGADLSPVRVHTGGASAAASEAVAARAYTLGHDVHFNAGQYRPDDSGGLRLLAHEVAHTVQQAGAAPARQHTPLQVSMPGDAAEVAADRAADAMLAGRPAAAQLGPASAGVHRQPVASVPAAPAAAAAPAVRPGGYEWVEFDENGGWDAADILTRMSQQEATQTATPDYLPGAGEESDRKRCGSNAALASAIVAGPATVIELCRNLRVRIASYKAKGISGAPEMPSAEQSDQADASVSSVMRDVFYGTKGMAHEAGGGTLQYRDLDKLAHWLYVFTFNPDDPGRVAGRAGVGDFQKTASGYDGRRWRSSAEIMDAAQMSGYAVGPRSEWMEMPTWEALTTRVDALPDGRSLLVLISEAPFAASARYIHTITFFRQAGVSYVHDSWQAGQVWPSTDPKYKESVYGAYDLPGGLKPRGLYEAKQPSMMEEMLSR